MLRSTPRSLLVPAAVALLAASLAPIAPVAAAGAAPTATPDAITLNEGGTATTLVGGGTSVLANDPDPENDPLVAVPTGDVDHGVLTLNPDGTFTYVHDGSETTTDSFAYRAYDGLSFSAMTTVIITVNPVNDYPVAVADSISVLENGTATTLVGGATSVLANDTDAENSPLSASLVRSTDHGSLALSPNGTFTYQPASGYYGPDSFRYQANDGTAFSDTVTVTITVEPVNEAPEAVADSLTVAEGGTATSLTGGATSVLANDSDPDFDPLTAAAVTEPVHGSLTLNANGTFTYVHDGSETTTDSFTYRASDGLAYSNTVTVAIAVNPVNDAPVAEDDAYSVDEGGALTVTAATRLTLNDTDAEDSPLTTALGTDVSHGDLTLNANGTFTYVHDGSETTTDSFTYRANDGTVDSNLATVTITVNPANDAPVAVADSLTVAEGGTATTLAGGATSVLANDTDPENDVLTAAVVSGPGNGSLTLNPNGTFSYVHDGSETTTDSFTYRANDGTANSSTVTVTITVSPVNDAPVAVDDSYSTDEDTTLTVTAAGKVTLNDTDAESNPLTVSLVANTGHGSLTLNADGTFTYTPANGYSGSDSFTYRASDGTVSSNIATVTITVNPVNSEPDVEDDSLTVAEGGTATTLDGGATSVLANDTDPEDDDLTAVVARGPAHGALILNADGTFSYVHDGSETTTDSFTYRADDGTTTSDTVTVAITVTPVNDAPIARDDSFVTPEDTQLVVALSDVLSNDTDAEQDALTAVLVSGPAHGTLALGTNGTFSYTPAGDYGGPDSFTYRADDGTARSGVATVSLTVTPVNDVPVISRLRDRVVRVDGRTNRLAFTVSDDAAVGDLKVSARSDNARLVPRSAIRATGSGADRQVRVSPASGRWGTAVVTLRVTDAAGATATTSFTLTVLRGRACTIRGTAGDDVLVGTSGPDVICGLGGDDVIRGLGGDDELRGGPGDNRLVGGAGDDVLLGRDGDETLLGGAGDDVLLGRAGDDVLDGGSGTNVLLGGAGKDVVRRTA